MDEQVRINYYKRKITETNKPFEFSEYLGLMVEIKYDD